MAKKFDWPEDALWHFKEPCKSSTFHKRGDPNMRTQNSIFPASTASSLQDRANSTPEAKKYVHARDFKKHHFNCDRVILKIPESKVRIIRTLKKGTPNFGKAPAVPGPRRPQTLKPKTYIILHPQPESPGLAP